jgi:VanZ family protein
LKKFFHAHLWGLLWGLLIIVLTTIPGEMIPNVPTFLDLFQPDKIVHLFLFSVFVFFLIRGFRLPVSPGFIAAHAVALALNIGIFIGGLTEILQKYFVYGRDASIYDFIADAAGCFVGWWAYRLWAGRKK